MSTKASNLLNAIETWALTRDDVVGLLLVGSHARGEAGPDSDLDIVVLTENTAPLLANRTWTERFGVVQSCEVEDWGAVTSLRVRYASGLEVEFGITQTSWASVDPLDPGTRRVLEDGHRVLFDPRGLLDRLQEHLKS